MVYRVLFVCLGNICRSPMAEVVFRALIAEAGLQDRVQVESAATGDWHVGEQAHPSTLDVLTARGFDGSTHRARKLSRDWFDKYDLLVAMDRMNVKALQQLARTPEDLDKIELLRAFDQESVNLGELDVPDPYGDAPPAFEHVFAIVDASCRSLLEHVRAAVAI
ncbi:MAG: low molecular weight protein-tyrosine-phosphatase [Actinomycetes bacterium]